MSIYCFIYIKKYIKKLIYIQYIIDLINIGTYFQFNRSFKKKFFYHILKHVITLKHQQTTSVASFELRGDFSFENALTCTCSGC